MLAKAKIICDMLAPLVGLTERFREKDLTLSLVHPGFKVYLEDLRTKSQQKGVETNNSLKYQLYVMFTSKFKDVFDTDKDILIVSQLDPICLQLHYAPFNIGGQEKARKILRTALYEFRDKARAYYCRLKHTNYVEADDGHDKGDNDDAMEIPYKKQQLSKPLNAPVTDTIIVLFHIILILFCITTIIKFEVPFDI